MRAFFIINFNRKSHKWIVYEMGFELNYIQSEALLWR